MSKMFSVPRPFCRGMAEIPEAAAERAKIEAGTPSQNALNPLQVHLSHGLAYTPGSALGCTPPTTEECLTAFKLPSSVGLSAGARAWSKHFHRSQADGEKTTNATKEGWWGTPKGPVKTLNESAELLFWRITDNASWRNLHWLPHNVLAYEVRVPEGYGMRWSQDRNINREAAEEVEGVYNSEVPKDLPLNDFPAWVFRGFLEPPMENGHEKGWRH